MIGLLCSVHYEDTMKNLIKRTYVQVSQKFPPQASDSLLSKRATKEPLLSSEIGSSSGSGMACTDIPTLSPDAQVIIHDRESPSHHSTQEVGGVCTETFQPLITTSTIVIQPGALLRRAPGFWWS
jgi:hypothetical protein